MIFSNFNTVKLEDITDKMATILFARVVDSEDWSRRKQNLDKISTKRWKKLTLEKQPKIKHHVTSKTQFRWMKPCDVSGLQGKVFIVVFIPVFYKYLIYLCFSCIVVETSIGSILVTIDKNKCLKIASSLYMQVYSSKVNKKYENFVPARRR